MVSLDHQTPFEKPVAFVMLQVFQVVQSSVIVVSMTCVNSALVKTLTRRGVLRSRKISTNTCRVLVFWCWCFGFGVVVALSCFCFLFCKCFGIPNSPRILDLDDRQGLIASSAMQ